MDKTVVVLAFFIFHFSFFTFADELSVAKEALRDGLWGIARTHAGTNTSDEARLVVLESLAGEGKWDEIGTRLSTWKEAKGDGFDYYRAVVKGDHAEAMEILKRGGSSEGIVQAKLYEAEMLAKAGKTDQANGIWREIVSSTNVGMRVLAVAGANLMDAKVLRRAYAGVKDPSLRRMSGLRLGMALLRFRNGALGMVEGTVNTYGNSLEETLYLFGSNGTVKLGGKAANKVEFWSIAGDARTAEDLADALPDTIYGLGHTSLYTDVIDAINTGRAPYVTAQDGMEALELVLAIYKSAAEGKPVKLPLEDCSTLDFAGRFGLTD